MKWIGNIVEIASGYIGSNFELKNSRLWQEILTPELFLTSIIS
jgi:hypothetical protein